jgi:hypothetical protein
MPWPMRRAVLRCGKAPGADRMIETFGRRQFTLGGAAASLAGLARPANAMTDYEKTLYDAAKKETEVTWYTSQILG